jgi:hypothetical protein
VGPRFRPAPPAGELNDLARNPELDLYPEELRAQIDEVRRFVKGGGDALVSEPW